MELCDLAFMVNVTKHLSELYIKLQGVNQLVSSLLSNEKALEGKLRLQQAQLDGKTLILPSSPEHRPNAMTEYSGECAKLVQSFGARFHEVKCPEGAAHLLTPLMSDRMAKQQRAQSKIHPALSAGLFKL